MILFNQDKIYFLMYILLISNTEHIKAKQFHFKFFWFRLLVQNKVKNVATSLLYLPFGNHIVISLWWVFQSNQVIKPMKLKVQTWLTNITQRWVPKLFFLSIRCSKKFQTEGVTNWSKKTRNKRTTSWIL